MANREIKFRAWDKDEQKMLRPPVELQKLLRQISARDDNSLGGDAIRKHALEWMQFTGLKDSKGVEIYEGDILAVPNGDEFANLPVIWNSPGFGASLDGIPVALLDADEWAVIGNIYENPELLKIEKSDDLLTAAKRPNA